MGFLKYFCTNCTPFGCSEPDEKKEDKNSKSAINFD